MATAKKIFPLVLLGLASIPAWGQAGKTATPNSPQVFDAPRVTTPGADSAPQPVNPKSYLIGPEDVIRIEVFRDNDMSRVVNVRPDGKITLPLVGDIQAEGLTPERLAATIKEALVFNRNPEVTISILAVNSKSFSVTGRVNRVGRWPLVTPVKVFDAIGLAGGLQEFANEKGVLIIHADGTSTKFNYKDFLKRKKDAIDQNIFLQNGDTVVIK